MHVYRSSPPELSIFTCTSSLPVLVVICNPPESLLAQIPFHLRWSIETRLVLDGLVTRASGAADT